MRALLTLIISLTFSMSSYSQMVLSGSATGSCDCYELTDFTNEAGSIWSPATIDLTNPFDFSFEVNLGADDVWGADGMMFALRQSGTTTGGIGNGMGYSGITNSVGVEIDTWNSSPAVPTDIASDHLAMSSNGNVDHDLVGTTAIANIEDGLAHTFRAVWDPVTFDLEIYLDGASIFVYNGDLVTLFFGGTPDVYFGWSGGTGGVDNIQSVCMYRDAEFTVDIPTACVDQVVTFTDASTSDLIYNGDEALTWSWNFGDGTTSILENPTHSYATTGTYTVTLTITDISGCSDTETLDITITDGLDVTMTHTDVTCFGLDDGTGTATPTTGTGPYTYLWDDVLAQTTTTSTGLGPNTYNVVVTDAVGCVGNGAVTILEPIELIIDSSTPTNASCGLANGTITIIASGGSPVYEYSIDGGLTYFPTGSFTTLLNGSYDVMVRDANGCTVTTTTVVDLDSPLIIDGIATTDVSCGPFDDGTITVTASAGVAPFMYSIDGGVTFQASNYFDLLSAGTYTVTVEDAAGCSVSMDATIGALSTIVIDMVAVTEPTCNGGADGEIDITVSGGTPAYQYSIDGGATFAGSPLFTGLIAGAYAVEVVDAAGCTITEPAVITEPTLVNIDLITPTVVSCIGLSDGGFNLIVSGGTPGYMYSNDAGATFQASPDFAGLSAGAYDLVITDVNGCNSIGIANVTEPTPVVIDDIIVTDVTCNGLFDGEVAVVASGGTGPFQYSVDAGPLQLSPVFTGLGGGAVTVDIIDANGCAETGGAFISEADPIVMTLDTDTTICLGGEATLCPTVSGGTAPYTFIWDGAPDAFCLGTSVIGVHTLQIEDINGCTSEVEEQIVNQYVPLSVLSSASMSVCPGDEVVLAGEADGEGPMGYSYEWTNDADATVLSGAVQTVNPESTTVYTLTVSSGCENTASTTVTITTFPIPDIIITADVTSGCEDLPVNLTSLTNPALVAELQWDLGEGTTATTPTVSNTFVDAMCYDINLAVTTIDGCELNETFEDYICVWQLPVADFSFEPETPNLFNTTVDFENESEFASVYEWTFREGSNSTEVSPSHTYPELGNQSYTIELKAITDKGCRDSIQKNILVEDVVLYYIPNAFTPNSDPLNQTFDPVFIPGFYPQDYHLTIFNRWGEVIWESYDQTEGWDGSYGGRIVDDGTYIWRMTFRENTTDRKVQDEGHFTVLK